MIASTAEPAPGDSELDLGLYVHLHCLVTDGVFEDHGEGVRFLPADPPTPARMTVVLAQVHEAVLAANADDDLDMDPTLRACVQRSLAGPHLAPAAEPVTPPPLTMSAFGMHLHAATTVDGRDRPQLDAFVGGSLGCRVRDRCP